MRKPYMGSSSMNSFLRTFGEQEASPIAQKLPGKITGLQPFSEFSGEKLLKYWSNFNHTQEQAGLVYF